MIGGILMDQKEVAKVTCTAAKLFPRTGKGFNWALAHWAGILSLFALHDDANRSSNFTSCFGLFIGRRREGIMVRLRALLLFFTRSFLCQFLFIVIQASFTCSRVRSEIGHSQHNQ